MTDFLLELRCEEIPARMQAGARADLEKLFREHMKAAGVAHGELTVWSTPRRLALIARELPQATEAVREEMKGPRVSAPPQALEGFLRKVGLTQDQLEVRGDTYFAVIERQGRATREVLAWAIAAIVRAFPWPKSMRWGAASIATDSLRWVRPLSGIVAIFGEELVECRIDGIESGYATLGHRFHHPGPITIGGADDYQEKLRACHVIVDHAERENLIRERAAQAAADAGLSLVAEHLQLHLAGFDRFRRPLWLDEAAARAWRHLQHAARRDGVVLEAISGYRSHDYQLGIFERKLGRGQSVDEILAVNAAPGFSEHHSGRALDIGTPGEPPAEETFEATAAFEWLRANAAADGFVLSYPRDNPHGITYEPWHWRFNPGSA